MRALLDTSVLIGAEELSDFEGAISAASLAELHFGVLVAADDDERARRALRLGVIESSFEPLAIDAAVAREWGRLAAAVRARGGQPRRRALDLAIAATAKSTTSRCSPTTSATSNSSTTSSTSAPPDAPLAAETCETFTTAVTIAIAERLQRVRGAVPPEHRCPELTRITDRSAARPPRHHRTADDVIGYGPTGLLS